AKTVTYVSSLPVTYVTTLYTLLARARLPCKKTAPENAMLRQVGGRPMVAPTHSLSMECDFLTRCVGVSPYPHHPFTIKIQRNTSYL
ncbi:hypothetical protein, partial [uncultured Gemmiger sp.]|uniref:hypothetical protein n=1 Tax=uncultured Gemmiger sp. TaxID=1623490 RepID=UPI0025D36EDB